MLGMYVFLLYNDKIFIILRASSGQTIECTVFFQADAISFFIGS